MRADTLKAADVFNRSLRELPYPTDFVDGLGVPECVAMKKSWDGVLGGRPLVGLPPIPPGMAHGCEGGYGIPVLAGHAKLMARGILPAL